MKNLTKEQIVENILKEYKQVVTDYLTKSGFGSDAENYIRCNQMSYALYAIGYSKEEEKALISEIRKELGLLNS